MTPSGAGKMSKILIIDDDEMICKAISMLLKKIGHEAAYACTLKNGLDKAISEPFDVVYLDVRMPDGNGLEIIPKLKETESSPEVIIITAAGDPDSAELAIKSGAWDYIEKASSLKEMMLPINRVLQYRQEKTKKIYPVSLKRDRIIGNSPQIRACLDFVAQAAVSGANVLIIGETGTGKELFAHAIHANQPIERKNLSIDEKKQLKNNTNRNFVVVDCAALPKTLVESVLFGHEKGAFTGAETAREGLVKLADGGTLFLDEIGELPLSMQKSFLRVLQERRFRPLGAKNEVTSKFRLIAATNKDLDQMVKKGLFREDLLFRIKSLNIELPPLRVRIEDIKEITRFHVSRVCDLNGIETKGFSPEFFEALGSYDWPGNVRELLNTIDSALSNAADDPTLFVKHLPTYFRVQRARASVSRDKSIPKPTGKKEDPEKPFPKYKIYRQTLERKYLIDILALTDGDTGNACQISGLSRSRFYELLSKFDLSTSK